MLKLTAAVSFAATFFCGTAARAASVNAAADIASGLSYKADPSLANSLSGTTQFKTALANGDDLAPGTRVYFGSFNITDTQISASAQNVAFLTQNFASFGFLTIGSGAGFENQVGHFSGTVSNNATSFFGKQIYMFVIAATDYSTPATINSSAFQLGVYYADKSVATNWAFPSSNPSDTAIDLADLTVGQDGLATNAAARLLIGNLGPDMSNLNTSAKNFTLASVPEPATGLMAAVGAAGLLLRRRRVD